MPLFIDEDTIRGIEQKKNKGIFKTTLCTFVPGELVVQKNGTTTCIDLDPV